MTRFALLGLLLAAPAFAQLKGLPALIELTPGVPQELTLDVAADDVAFAPGGSFFAGRMYSRDPGQVVVMLLGWKEGDYQLLVFTAGKGADGKSVISKHPAKVRVGSGGPPAPPVPLPDPPQPPPGPQPDVNPVNERDADWPGPPTAAQVQAARAAAAGLKPGELYALAVAHVKTAEWADTAAGKAATATQALLRLRELNRATGLASLPGPMVELLGGRVNTALPADPDQVLGEPSRRAFRRELLGIASTLYHASR